MVIPSALQAIGAAAATAAAATAAVTAYTDAKLGLTIDRKYVQADRQFGKLLGEHIKKLGDHVSLYHMLELANPDVDALWFEGKTWTYKQMLEGKQMTFLNGPEPCLLTSLFNYRGQQPCKVSHIATGSG